MRCYLRPRCVVALTMTLLLLPWLETAAAPRVTRDLRALYTFDAGSGVTVHDRSGVGQPLDLKIDRPAAVQWGAGALVIRSAAKIRTAGPAKKITTAVKRSHAVTIEAWVRPRSDRQTGPARIVSLSADPNQRNFTLGQDGTRYDARLRTTSTSSNGIPSTPAPSKSVKTALTHVVHTRDADGKSRIYLNGQPQATQNVAGQLSNWNDNFKLVLADELTGGRPWLGELHLVAIYSRALTAGEVERHFKAGASTSIPTSPALPKDPNAKLFESSIAPLLARSCLDCHDSASKKGQLDLSKQAAALSGGESGKVILPGNATDSLLWQHVESGDMPPEGEALSADEKDALRQWIDHGATWTLAVIDPVIYTHHENASQNWVRRLTIPEYIETVNSAVGVDISQEARELLPPDLRADGFSNTAYNLNVDLKHVETYARLAETIVGRMDVMQFAARFSKSRKLSTDATMRDFVASMGKWLLRGPLDEREITNFSGIVTTVASAGGDYREAVSFLIEAMLQSPRFVYRIEQQRGDGAAMPISSYELASRLSYIIWGGPPDQELMRAADDGQLYNPDHVQLQVGRMLQDPRAIPRSARFVSEWLNLDRLQSLQPDRQRFPDWTAEIGADMREETLAFFQEITWNENRPLADLFNAQFTYATPRLAKHYGLTPKAPGLSRYDLSTVPARGGLLTQGSVLTVGGDDASMVTRGLFVLHDLLRGTVKDPPPGLDITPVPSKPGLSQRSISEQRIANVSCGGCHLKFEPLAFGLEKFDGLGAFREKDEYGNQLRDDGEILFPGAAEPVRYRTAAELMDLLAGSDRVRETITWKVTQFALGRPLVAADAPIIAQIHRAAQEGGGNYASLITAIVMSDLVQLTRTERDGS